MRHLAWIWIVLFLLFAAFQMNDEDWYIWIFIYVIPAVFSFLAWRGVYHRKAMSIIAVFYYAYGIYLFPGSVSEWLHSEEKAKGLEMNVPFVEDARESLGLFICMICLLGYVWWSNRKTKPQQQGS